MKYQVYIIKNDINDKVYIGQTTENLNHRFSRHCGYQINNPDHFHRALKKYGKEHFNISLLKEVSSQLELDKEEIKYILSYPKDKLYNTKFTEGKCGGNTFLNNPNLDLIKCKISKSKLGGLNPNSKAIIAKNIITQEILLFSSMKEATDYLGLNGHSPISRRCRGIIKSPLNNTWIFKYSN